MNVHVAVDCGKYNTKVNAFNADAENKETQFLFRTKFSKGSFDDDMLGVGTYVVQVDDGEVFKVGYKATTEPEMNDTKKLEVHRVCTLAAIGMALGDGDFKDVHVAIGMPVGLIGLVEERHSYKDFILGQDKVKHSVKWMDHTMKIHKVTFTFGKRNVYPEGTGVIYEYSKKCNGLVGVIDIGNLNVNAVYVNTGIPNEEMCFSTKDGGNNIMNSLANELTRQLGVTVDRDVVSRMLTIPCIKGKSYDDRYLVPNSGNMEIAKKSKVIIDENLLNHVNGIKEDCTNAIKKWPIDFMQIVCVGGTTSLLKRELYDVFGENIFIPDNPEYVNVRGFLKLLCRSSNIHIHEEVAASKEEPKNGKHAA